MAREIKKIGLLSALAGVLSFSAVGCGAAPRPGSSLVVPVRTEPWKFGDVSGQKLSTQHYRIYTTSGNRGLLRNLPGFLESCREQYLLLTGLEKPPAPAKPMPIYLLATRPQWAIMTERVTGPRSSLYLSIENGGYAFAGVCVFWDLGHFATFSVAAHEGLHQFLYHNLRDPMPAWAEEGVAVLAEGFNIDGDAVSFTPERNTLRLADLRRALSSRRRIPLRKLLASDAGDHVGGSPTGSAEYYGQLWALMVFIRSEQSYRAGLERMIADAAGGKLRQALRIPPEMGTGRTYNRSVSVPVFQHYVHADLDRFEERFRAFARSLAKLD